MLETPDLVLRPPIEADFAGWAALDGDERATRFIGGPRGREQSWLGLATAAGMWALRGYGLFSVVERATGQWVGRVGPWVPEGAPGTEIGWALPSSQWGRGRATEAAAAAMGWAFDHLGWAEAIHCIDAENLASIAVAERLGSRWLRTERGKDGVAVQVYGQSRQQWRERQQFR